MIQIHCEYCGKSFFAERNSARYCCDSHKTLASRERKNLEVCELKMRQRQIASDAWERRLENERKEAEAKAANEAADRKRKEDEERKIYKERKQNREFRKRMRENEAQAKKADLQLKLLGLGLCVAYGIANTFTKSTVPVEDVKEPVDSSIMPDGALIPPDEQNDGGATPVSDE